MVERAGRSQTVKSGVVVAVATGVMNAATYAFTLLCAHVLGPADYGAFAAMLGLVIVVNVVSLGLQATGARRVAATPGDRHLIESKVIATSVRAGIALAIVCLALSPVIAAVLQLDSWVTAALLAVPALSFAIMGGQAGILQGEGRWFPLAVVFSSLGLARLGIGAVFLAFRPDALGAVLGGVAVAAVVPVLVGAAALRRASAQAAAESLPPASGRSHSRIVREAMMSSHALLAFFALATIDIVVARTALDAHPAGIYAAGLILVKAVQFLPQFVTVVAFPAMARQGGGHRVHLGGLGLILLIGGTATMVVGIWGDLALPFVGGDAYAEVVPRLWVFATIGTLLAAVQLLVYSALARAHHRAVLFLWGAVAAILVSTPWVDSVGRLLMVTVSVDLALLLVLLFVTRLGSRRAAPDDRPVRAAATA
ncbi:MAG TPA: hypothetical protein VIR15_04480 [Intrasporangium sp.]|uniref:lipopolysaccharide biosynthesis protein n=1 Tax=Intrasporangium sp. TaxID=1925024 RepID=UPI002F933376